MKTLYFFVVVLLVCISNYALCLENSDSNINVGQSNSKGTEKDTPKADPKLIMTVSPKNLKCKPGKTVTLRLNVKVPKTWHLYGTELQENKDGIGPQATEITLKDSTPNFSFGKINSPKTKTEYDEGFEMNVKTMEGDLKIDIPLTVSPETEIGKYKSTIAIYFQMCDGKTCLTPHEETVPFEVEIVR